MEKTRARQQNHEDAQQVEPAQRRHRIGHVAVQRLRDPRQDRRGQRTEQERDAHHDADARGVVARIHHVEERRHEVRVVDAAEESEAEHRDAAEEERRRKRHPGDERNAEAESQHAELEPDARTPLHQLVADAAADHDADDRAQVMPEDGVQPRPVLQERTRLAEVFPQVSRHPVLEADVDVDHHREPQDHAQRRRLGKDRLERLANRRLARNRTLRTFTFFTFTFSFFPHRFRVLEEDRERDGPGEADAAEDPERDAPALAALPGDESRKAAAADDADVEAELQDRDRRRARLLVELRDERGCGRIVERLSEAVQDAVGEDQQPHRRDEARGEDAEAEDADADRHHPLAVEEVRRQSRERHADAVHHREDRPDDADRHLVDAERRAHRRHRRTEQLPRALLQEECHPKERQRPPLVVRVFHNQEYITSWSENESPPALISRPE